MSDIESPQALGATAELVAARYLQADGYQIINQNFSAAGGEIDLIALDGDVLCFVEVRAFRDDQYGDPLETIDRPKQRRIIRAAQCYLESWSGKWPEARFDAVGVVFEPKVQIELIKGAFDTTD